MHKKLHIILFITVLFISCGKTGKEKQVISNNDSTINKSKNQESIVSLQKKPIKNDSNQTFNNLDTARLLIDTSILLPNYKLAFTKEKYNLKNRKIATADIEFNPFIIFVIDKKTDSTIYHQKFEENLYENLISFNQVGKTTYYLSLMTFDGGSGYLIDWYRINEKEPFFTKICTYNELSWPAFNKNGTELLVLKGIWNFDENESHFAEHRYQITQYNLKELQPKEMIKGNTEYKYQSIDKKEQITTATILKHIKEKEPQLLKDIDLSTYFNE